MNTNTEIVKQAYADFLQGNIPALVEKMSDDVVWELPASAEVPFSGVFKGKDGVMRFFKEIATLNDFQEFNLEDVLSGENKVVVTEPESYQQKHRQNIAKPLGALLGTKRR